MDAIWTTMEEWSASVELNYGIFCLIPIFVILAIALWKKDTFMSILAGLIVAILMAAKFNPIVAIALFLDESHVMTVPCGYCWYVHSSVL